MCLTLCAPFHRQMPWTLCYITRRVHCAIICRSHYKYMDTLARYTFVHLPHNSPPMRQPMIIALIDKYPLRGYHSILHDIQYLTTVPWHIISQIGPNVCFNILLMGRGRGDNNKLWFYQFCGKNLLNSTDREDWASVNNKSDIKAILYDV